MLCCVLVLMLLFFFSKNVFCKWTVYGTLLGIAENTVFPMSFKQYFLQFKFYHWTSLIFYPYFLFLLKLRCHYWPVLHYVNSVAFPMNVSIVHKCFDTRFPSFSCISTQRCNTTESCYDVLIIMQMKKSYWMLLTNNLKHFKWHFSV